MSDLSPRSRALLTDGAAALDPSASARVRIRAGVAARVAATAAAAPATAGTGETSASSIHAPTGSDPTAGSAAAMTATSGAAAVIKLTLAVALVAAVVAGAAVWFRGAGRGGAPVVSPPSISAPSSAAPPVVSPPSPALPSAMPPVVPPGPVPAAAEPMPRPAIPPTSRATAPARVPTRSPGRARKAAPPRDAQTGSDASELALEVELLGRARRQLSDGAPTTALAVLERHRRELDAPQLAREAALLRAEALCASGRRAEGERELARAGLLWPSTPGRGAVLARCRETQREP